MKFSVGVEKFLGGFEKFSWGGFEVFGGGGWEISRGS